MGWVQPTFWVVILLGIMILIHELGHFVAALAMGVKVETFSIGFGPRLFGFRRGDTDFRVSAVFFGGYVKMLGDQPGESIADPRSFQAKARWQRAFIIFAGPFMNVLLAVGIIAGLYMYGFPKQIEPADPVIASVKPHSPAADAGIRSGDKIVQIGERKDPTWTDVAMKEVLNANAAIPVVVDRAGEKLQFVVTPRMDPKEGIGEAGWSGEQTVEIEQVLAGSPAQRAGLQPGDAVLSVNDHPAVSPLSVQQAVIHSAGKPLRIVLMRNGQLQNLSVAAMPTNDPKLPWRIGAAFGYKMRVRLVKLGLGPAIVESVRQNGENATLFFKVLQSLLEHRVSAKTISGPVGIAQMSGEMAREGAQPFLDFAAMISLQLAIFNLFPVPVLDGGSLLLLFIEMLLQREMSLRVRETVFKVGFVVLMMIVVFALYNDISRILTHS